VIFYPLEVWAAWPVGTSLGDQMKITDLELKHVVYTLGLLIILAFVGALITLIVTEWHDEGVHKFVIEHFRVIVGLPAAGLFAFVIVAFFQEHADAKVEYKVFGLEFKGPGGPISMWILAFLAIAAAIYTNWQ
jgi:ABC-type proline/glycine betaine transport system permease subunit